MNKFEFDLSNIAPKADAGYSGNMLDPLQVRINKALGSFGAIPPFFIPERKDIITAVYDESEILEEYTSVGIIHSQMPIKIKRMDDAEWFTLPIEPLVSISGKNVIVRRTVAKGVDGGTIKERWSQDDYTVTIRGVITEADEGKYPADHLKKMLALFNERKSVEVSQAILLLFGIKYLAIESVSFPHTKGLNNQNFEITAYSDSSVELLISV